MREYKAGKGEGSMAVSLNLLLRPSQPYGEEFALSWPTPKQPVLSSNTISSSGSSNTNSTSISSSTTKVAHALICIATGKCESWDDETGVPRWCGSRALQTDRSRSSHRQTYFGAAMVGITSEGVVRPSNPSGSTYLTGALVGHVLLFRFQCGWSRKRVGAKV